ncbi:unnamed protein product [Hyaloperonospora brassicae]|uniref:PX domain-containing protein n=1 Tax=Hyaloperonospora brassicae TaxID=162125 RepID=A0AAV0T1Z1_HYABA|nr:unnamed protein product [Hyaloperonospora brassicae]
MKTLSAHISGFYWSSFHAYTTEVAVHGHRWRLGLRYSKFHSFYDQLMEQVAGFDAEFPPKGTLFFTPKPEERQQQLEVFLQQVLAFYAAKGYPVEVENLLCDLLKVPGHLRSPEHEDDDDGSTGTESGLDELVEPNAKKKTVDEEGDEELKTKSVAMSGGAEAHAGGGKGSGGDKEKEDVVAAAELVPTVAAVALETSSAEQTAEARGEKDEADVEAETSVGADDSEEADGADEEAKVRVETATIAASNEGVVVAEEEGAEALEAVKDDEGADAADDVQEAVSTVERHDEVDGADEETTDAQADADAIEEDGEEGSGERHEAETQVETPVMEEDCGEDQVADDEEGAQVETLASEEDQEAGREEHDAMEAQAETRVMEEDREEASTADDEVEAQAKTRVIEEDCEEARAVDDDAEATAATPLFAEDSKMTEEATVEDMHQEDTTDCAVQQTPVEAAAEEAVKEVTCTKPQECTALQYERPCEQSVVESEAHESTTTLSSSTTVEKRFASESLSGAQVTKNPKQLDARRCVYSWFTVQLPKSMLQFIRQRCMRKTNLAVLCVALLLPVVLGRS